MNHNYENLAVYNRSLGMAVKIMEVIDDVRPFRLAEQIVSSSISQYSQILLKALKGVQKRIF